MNTVETRTRTTATHPAVDPHCAAAARLAREATLRHTAAEACRAVVDALSTPALGYEGIALLLDPGIGRSSRYQVMAGNWPPAPHVDSTAVLTVPLLLDDARVGELTVYHTRERAFGEADAALVIAAASHAALGVARALLVEELNSVRGRKRRKTTPARRKAAGRKAAGRKAASRKAANRKAANRKAANRKAANRKAASRKAARKTATSSRPAARKRGRKSAGR